VHQEGDEQGQRGEDLSHRQTARSKNSRVGKGQAVLICNEGMSKGHSSGIGEVILWRSAGKKELLTEGKRTKYAGSDQMYPGAVQGVNLEAKSEGERQLAWEKEGEKKRLQ